MKVAALALVLLAVGTHAASLQADAPSPLSQLQHVRAAMAVYLTTLKDSLLNVVDQLDDAEYKDMKETMKKGVLEAFTRIQALQDSVSPVTDSVFTTIADATAEVRASIHANIDELKTDLEPKRVALKEVIDKHLAQYQELLGPITREYYKKFNADMVDLKTKLDPILTQLTATAATNLEETKTAAMPIVESIRAKLSERLEALKVMTEPYVNEYKEQMKAVYDQAQGITTDDRTKLMEKITHLAEDVQGKLTEMFEAIRATFMKEPTNSQS